MRVYIILILIASIALKAEAQSRILHVMESPSSPKSLSLGNTKMGRTDDAYIYNNPSALFATNSKTADYSLGIIPSEDNNTYTLHTLTAGYGNNKSAFLAGGRFLSMGTFDDWLDNNMTEDVSRKKVSFYSYTIDLGYAYKFSNKVSAYSTIGYTREETISSIWAYRVDVGSNYNGNCTLLNRNIEYSVGISAGNLGKYFYKGKSDFLSPNIKLGGSVHIPTASEQILAVFIDGGAFLPVSDNKSSSSLSVGADYSFLKKYAIRFGGHTGDNDDFLSAGFGIKYQIFDLSFGSKIALRKDLNNMYMLGLKVEI